MSLFGVEAAMVFPFGMSIMGQKIIPVVTGKSFQNLCSVARVWIFFENASTQAPLPVVRWAKTPVVRFFKLFTAKSTGIDWVFRSGDSLGTGGQEEKRSEASSAFTRVLYCTFVHVTQPEFHFLIWDFSVVGDVLFCDRRKNSTFERGFQGLKGLKSCNLFRFSQHHGEQCLCRLNSSLQWWSNENEFHCVVAQKRDLPRPIVRAEASNPALGQPTLLSGYSYQVTKILWWLSPPHFQGYIDY